jgi:hypothetical protein
MQCNVDLVRTGGWREDEGWMAKKKLEWENILAKLVNIVMLEYGSHELPDAFPLCVCCSR